MYYVYIHKEKQTGAVVYVGKGSGYRYCGTNSRNKEHASMMKEGKLENKILRYFDDEKEAYINEEKITAFYKKLGQCRFNDCIGRRLSDKQKEKLSKILKGQKRSKETKERMKKNHSDYLYKPVLMYKDGKFVRRFRSSREAGRYAAENNVCSHGWVGRSLKTGEPTKSTRHFPIGGFLFVYEDDKMSLKKADKLNV